MAVFDQAAAVEHQDAVGTGRRREAVGNGDRRAPFGDAALRTHCAGQQPQRDADALAAAVLRFRDGAA